MRLSGGVALVLVVLVAARPVVVSAQDGPRLEPRLSFDVASVKVINQRERSPMQWQPPGHFMGGVPILSLVSIGYLIPARATSPANGSRKRLGPVSGPCAVP